MMRELPGSLPTSIHWVELGRCTVSRVAGAAGRVAGVAGLVPGVAGRVPGLPSGVPGLPPGRASGVAGLVAGVAGLEAGTGAGLMFTLILSQQSRKEGLARAAPSPPSFPACLLSTGILLEAGRDGAGSEGGKEGGGSTRLLFSLAWFLFLIMARLLFSVLYFTGLQSAGAAPLPAAARSRTTKEAGPGPGLGWLTPSLSRLLHCPPRTSGWQVSSLKWPPSSPTSPAQQPPPAPPCFSAPSCPPAAQFPSPPTVRNPSTRKTETEPAAILGGLSRRRCGGRGTRQMEIAY